MSTTTTNPESTVAVPSTITVAGEERHVMRGATWTFYDRFTDALGERALFRVAYDGRDIEIMTLVPNTSGSKSCWAYLSTMSVRGSGSTAKDWARQRGNGPNSSAESKQIYVKTSLQTWIRTELKPRVDSE
jgi:hypothetical protein